MEGVHPFILPPTPDLLLKPSSLRIFFTLPSASHYPTLTPPHPPITLPSPSSCSCYPILSLPSSSHYSALSIFMLLLTFPLITLFPNTSSLSHPLHYPSP